MVNVECSLFDGRQKIPGSRIFFFTFPGFLPFFVAEQSNPISNPTHNSIRTP